MYKNSEDTLRQDILKWLLLALILVLAFWVSGIVKDSEFVSNLIRRFGYIGIFFVAVVTGFNLVVPIPAIAFLPIFVASGLNTVWTIIVLAAGMTMADCMGYLFGKAGQRIVFSAFEKKVIDKVEHIKEKLNWSPALILFLFASFAPLPNEVLVIPMAFLGYRLTHIFFPVLLGNIVFNSIYAIGVINILKLVG